MRSPAWVSVGVLSAVFGPLCAVPSLAQTFATVDGSGLGEYPLSRPGFGGGVAASDFDGDGDVDLYLPTAAGNADRLYRNRGDGTFEDVAAVLGLTDALSSRTALWFDADTDSRLDILVSGDCYETDCDPNASSIRLYRQDSSGVFANVTDAAGLRDTDHDPETHAGGIAAGDLDGDGDLDFVRGTWKAAFEIYLNQGDGTFEEVALLAGVDDFPFAYHQPVILDWNGDGQFDIYAAVDFDANRLWLNQGTVDGVPSFVEVSADAGCANAMNDMGVAVGDYDEDGDPDLYITNIHRDGFHNVLLRNDSTPESARCTERAIPAGVAEGGWGWGTTFLDVDLDADLDLAETNGWHTGPWRSRPRLFVHQGDTPATFIEDAVNAGLDAEAWGSALIAFDADRDGDLDLVTTIVKPDEGPRDSKVDLYANQIGPEDEDHRFLMIRPRMRAGNVHAIGARVAITLGSRTLHRWISAGSSYLGQEPAEAFFGLGATARVDRVVVTWPGGEESVLTDVAADQVLTVEDEILFSATFESGDLSAWSEVVP